MALWRRKVIGMERLHPVLGISAILIADILTKLNAPWLGIIVAAMLCVMLVDIRHGPQ